MTNKYKVGTILLWNAYSIGGSNYIYDLIVESHPSYYFVKSFWKHSFPTYSNENIQFVEYEHSIYTEVFCED